MSQDSGATFARNVADIGEGETMRPSAVLLLAAGLLGGCSQYTADLSYVRASGLGYRNAALYTAGYLFLWDTSTNQLTQLETSIPLQKAPSSEAPTTLTSTSVSGISIGGSFGTGLEKITAEAALSRKVAFTAENAVRENYEHTYTGLSQAYNAGIAAGEDMRQRWYVDEAIAAGSPYRYVLVVGLVRASNATASVGGKSGNEIGSVDVDVPGMGSIKRRHRARRRRRVLGHVGSLLLRAEGAEPVRRRNRKPEFQAGDRRRRGHALGGFSQALIRPSASPPRRDSGVSAAEGPIRPRLT